MKKDDLNPFGIQANTSYRLVFSHLPLILTYFHQHCLFRPSKQTVRYYSCCLFLCYKILWSAYSRRNKSCLMSGSKWRTDSKRGFTVTQTAGTVCHSMKWSKDGSVAGHLKSGRWFYVFFMLLKNLWLRFGWLSSRAWGLWAECILHTTAESHDVWPLCHAKLPSKEKGGRGGMCDWGLCRKR